MAANAGVDLAVAQRALSAFDAEYPGIARFADHVSRLREIVTPLGRRLPLNRDRSYIGINYYIQSTARAIFAQALFRLAAAGLMDHLWLPVHDKIIVSVPEQDTERWRSPGQRGCARWASTERCARGGSPGRRRRCAAGGCR